MTDYPDTLNIRRYGDGSTFYEAPGGTQSYTRTDTIPCWRPASEMPLPGSRLVIRPLGGLGTLAALPGMRDGKDWVVWGCSGEVQDRIPVFPSDRWMYVHELAALPVAGVRGE